MIAWQGHNGAFLANPLFSRRLGVSATLGHTPLAGTRLPDARRYVLGNLKKRFETGPMDGIEWHA